MTIRDDWLASPPLLDVGVGARLITIGLDLIRDDPCLWSLDHPDTVLHLHRQDYRAGARALVANSFGANSHRLRRLHRLADLQAINTAAVGLARSVVAQSGWVLGSIGPEASHEPTTIPAQAEALLNSGADALLVETLSIDEAETILSSLQPPQRTRVILSFRALPECDPLLPPSINTDSLLALGVNCLSIEATGRLLHRLRPNFDGPLLARPGRLPHEPSPDPNLWAEQLRAVIPDGPVLLGGCCGIGPAEIAALRRSSEDAPQILGKHRQ